MTKKISVHGMYPGHAWKTVRWIGAEEAAALLGVAMDAEMKELARESALYLFLNEGYVVLGAPPSNLSELELAVLEQACPSRDGQLWPVGARAIYLRNGRYSIIQRIKREPM